MVKGRNVILLHFIDVKSSLFSPRHPLCCTSEQVDKLWYRLQRVVKYSFVKATKYKSLLARVLETIPVQEACLTIAYKWCL
jgi:uncharacterized membrane protein YpjA